MTSLDGWADSVRGKATKVQMPKLSTLLVTLVALIPYLLGLTVNTVVQFLRILKAGYLKGWETGEERMGPAPRPSGGS